MVLALHVGLFQLVGLITFFNFLVGNHKFVFALGWHPISA